MNSFAFYGSSLYFISQFWSKAELVIVVMLCSPPDCELLEAKENILVILVFPSRPGPVYSVLLGTQEKFVELNW